MYVAVAPVRRAGEAGARQVQNGGRVPQQGARLQLRGGARQSHTQEGIFPGKTPCCLFHYALRLSCKETSAKMEQ